MIAFLNPKGISRLEWLEENGTEIDGNPSIFPTDGTSLVCLENNGRFHSASVMVEEIDLRGFIFLGGNAQKKWFSVPTDKLLDPTVSDLAWNLNKPKSTN